MFKHLSLTKFDQAEVLIEPTERADKIQLSMHELGELHPAALMTPAETRLIAHQLIAAAEFVEEAASKPAKKPIPPTPPKDSLPAQPAPAPPTPREGRPQRALSADDIVKAIKAANGNKSQAARYLGIGRLTLYRRLDLYGIRKFGSHKEPGHAD
jgi:transcriptional regulator of acetoin/glycerol metabolism